MLLTLEQIKLNLKLEVDYTEEDELLEMIGEDVQDRTETYLNRTLYKTAADIPDTDPDGLALKGDIRRGMLLLITHYYENRGASSEVEHTEMPFGYVQLVGPYRFIPL